MHSIRSKARHMAWRSDGPKDGLARYIPFAGRYGPSRANTLQDVENGDPINWRSTHERTHSEACLDSDQQIRDREEGQRGLSKRAQTAPIAPIKEVSPTSQFSSDKPWSANTASDSTKPISPDETLVAQSGRESDSTTVQRKGKMRWLSKMVPHKHKSGDDAELHKGSKPKKHNKFAETDRDITFVSQARVVLLGSWINVLLICVPIGIALENVHVDGRAVFVVNFIAIIPLAGMLSYATEEIAMRVGETLGGLLNASFGNAVELIVSIIALAKDEILIVKTSLIGSMFSNLLLVLGMCFFFGGWNKLEQYFNVTVAQTASSLLALAVGALLIPTFFDQGSNNSGSDEFRHAQVPALSRGVAVILLVVYICYLYFQLKTHSKIFGEAGGDARIDEDKIKLKKKSSVETIGIKGAVANSGAGAAASAGGAVNEKMTAQKQDEDEDEEVPRLTFAGAIVTLCVATAFVGVCAEYMVDGIAAVVQGGTVSPEFIGLILIPIVGNAAEHATAVTVAIKDKMDLAIGVAVGSSLQIALFVLPLSVIIGWILGSFHPEYTVDQLMTLEFDVFQIGLLFVAIILVNYLIQDGASHWLEGVLLMSTYVMIAVAAWFYPADASAVVG